MCRVLVSLLLFSLSACSLAMDHADDLTDAQLEARYAQLDTSLRRMAGANEKQLLSAMGRTPDTTFPAGDDRTRVLQWWWDTSYAGPACTPALYQSRSIGIYAPQRTVRQDCIVQWTVAKGTSETYRWQGYGCRSVNLVSMPAP